MLWAIKSLLMDMYITSNNLDNLVISEQPGIAYAWWFLRLGQVSILSLVFWVLATFTLLSKWPKAAMSVLPSSSTSPRRAQCVDSTAVRPHLSWVMLEATNRGWRGGANGTKQHHVRDAAGFSWPTDFPWSPFLLPGDHCRLTRLHCGRA